MLNQEILKELIHYNPDTGIFTWKPRSIKWFKSLSHLKSFETKSSGKLSGHIKKHKRTGKSYIEIPILGKIYQAHRLGFLYIVGNHPIEEIDHIDGNGLNNKWVNLREVDRFGNQKNRKLNSNNSSGYSGIYFVSDNKYRVKINHNGEEIHLGYYDLETAIKVRKEAETKYEYHENHGSFRPL